MKIGDKVEVSFTAKVDYIVDGLEKGEEWYSLTYKLRENGMIHSILVTDKMIVTAEVE